MCDVIARAPPRVVGTAHGDPQQRRQSVRGGAPAAKFERDRDASGPFRVEGKAGSRQFQFRAQPAAPQWAKTCANCEPARTPSALRLRDQRKDLGSVVFALERPFMLLRIGAGVLFDLPDNRPLGEA